MHTLWALTFSYSNSRLRLKSNTFNLKASLNYVGADWKMSPSSAIDLVQVYEFRGKMKN